MLRFLIFLELTLLLLFSANAQVFDMVVDAQGSGGYQTIQSAIDAVSNNKSDRTLILVLNGKYSEKILVPSSKVNVSLIGESQEGVIITWNDYAGSETGLSSAATATLQVDAKDFYMENVTVQNTAGRVGQALAIRTVGDRGVYKNCSFVGFQDTYYAHKARQYNYQCYVEGGVDFIYGDATAVFDECTVNCVSGGSYITAPADTKLYSRLSSGDKFYNGLMILRSEVTCNTDVSANSYYLGRPWQPDASSVFILCKLGNHIKSEGWHPGGDGNNLSGYYAEYQNTDLDGETIDVSQRVDWSHQITDEWFQNYYKLDYFFKKDGVIWEAKTMTKALLTPENLRVDGTLIRWDATDQAIGYVVFYNNSFVAITEAPSILADGMEIENVEVKSVRDNGVLSDPSNKNLLVGNNEFQLVEAPDVWFNNKTIYSSENIQLTIYSVNGVVLKSYKQVRQQSLSELPHGAYILKATNSKGKKIVQKFML